MTRAERTKWTRDFYHCLAVELNSHLANGSEFIYLDGSEDVREDIVALRIKILTQEVKRLAKKGHTGWVPR